MNPMTRRALLAFASAMCVAVSARAATEIRIGYALATTSHYGVGATAWGESVEKQTDGRIKFKHFPASSLGGEREMLDALKAGTLDAAILSTGTLGSLVPEIGVVDIPFLFRNAKHARSVLDGPVGDDILAKFSSHGLQALAWGEQGFRHLTNNKLLVKTPDDLKGLKVRTMENEVHQVAFRTLGASPMPMPWPEVVTSLQQGTIDGQENPVSVIVTTKLWKVQKYLTLTGHVYSPTVMFVSKKLWDSLTPADKEVFRKGAKAGSTAMRAFVDGVEEKGIAQLRSEGMQVATDVDGAAFQAALAPAYQQYKAKFGQDLLDRIRNTK